MVRIIQNAIRQDEIEELLRFFYVDDHYVCHHQWRDYRMKMLPYRHKDMPGSLKTIIDRIIDYPYQIKEDIILQEGSDFTSKLHVDSGPDKDHWGDAILIPIQVPAGDIGTVFFNNHLKGYKNDNPIFTHGISPDSGAAWNTEGRAIFIRDMNDLKPFMDKDGIFQYQGNHYEMNDRLRRKILAKTSNIKGGYYRNRTNDYKILTGFDKDCRIDDDFIQRWLVHHAAEDLQGLTVDKAVKWKLGEIIVFERTVLHCGSSTADGKIGITVIVDRK